MVVVIAVVITDEPDALHCTTWPALAMYIIEQYSTAALALLHFSHVIEYSLHLPPVLLAISKKKKKERREGGCRGGSRSLRFTLNSNCHLFLLLSLVSVKPLVPGC